MLLVIPFPWAAAWMIAAASHEFFHCLALFLCGKSITGITIGVNGAEIEAGMLNHVEMLLCSLAGPLGGLLLLLLSELFPRLAVCALVQSAFNLMPVHPLDGGRALRSAMGFLFSEHIARRICSIIEISVLSGVFLLCLVTSVLLRMGIYPVLLAVFFTLHTKKIKIPCKCVFHRVQ